MSRNTTKNEERAQVHGAHYAHSARALSRSPTRTTYGVRKKQNSNLSKTFSSAPSSDHQPEMYKPEMQQTTSFGRKEGSNAEGHFQTDAMKAQDTTKGDAITISVQYCDATQKKQELTVSRSCTLEEYMKWKFILSSQAILDQFNVYIKKEQGIVGAINRDSIMYVQKQVKRSKELEEMCDRLVEYAMGYLGQGLRVTEVDIQCGQLDVCAKDIGQMSLCTYTEVLGGHLYVVFRNRDQKQIMKYVGDLVERGDKRKHTTKKIVAKPVWNKMAYVMCLDIVLKLHCKCPDFDVTLETHPDKCVINLTGPETAIDMANEEVKRLEQRLQCEKCNLQVTSKFALLELQVETFLDEHLSKHNMQCVTQQKNDAIYVFGFSNECLLKANREIEAIIIEKLCVVKGHLKSKKDMLVSYVSSRWPGKVVIRFADGGGLLQVVGVKKCVEDTCQVLLDLNERKIKLEHVESKHTIKVVETKTEEVTAEAQTREDGSQDATKQNVNQKQAFETGEKINRRRKSERNSVFDKTSENYDRSRTGSHSDERRSEPDLRGNSIPNEKNGTERGIAEGKISTVENTAASKRDKVNTYTKYMDNACRNKQDIKTVSKIEVERNMSNDTIESNDSALKFIDENTDGKEVVQTACGENQKEMKVSQFKQDRSIFKTKESETVFECMNFIDKKIWQFMIRPDARIFLDECANKNNVRIHQYVNRDSCTDGLEVVEDVFIIPNEGIERTVSWTTTDKKQMVLTMKRRMEDMVDRGSRFVLVKFKEHRHNKESMSIPTENENGVTVTLRVPRWNGRKGNDQEQLTTLLVEFLLQAEETKMDHVIIPLETVHNWPETSFIPCVISEVVEGIFLNAAPKTPHMVTLLLSDENQFEQAFSYTDKRIRKVSEAAKRVKQNQLQVIVIAGELDKTKADVIVNTTSRDLELSNGKVSTTLLKAAGSGIQAECRANYPRGISRQQVAVTGGYNLKCENVFHIALDRYIAQQEMQSIQSIRSFVITCLKIASDLQHKTIAFPAIGTGVLKYPIDLVAAAMFESVERFKSEHTDTSLTTVFFVIYPADVKVMEVFKKNEETLEKPPEERTNVGQGTKVQIEISGHSENIASAKSCLLERCEDELYDPSKILQESFSGVTFHVYLALLHLFENGIKHITTDGIEIKHQDDILLLSGKRKELKRASEMMNEYLDSVSRYSYSSLTVQSCKTEAVEGEVKLINQKKDTVCIFDKYRDIVHIYAHSARKAGQVMNLLKEKLGLTQCQTSPVDNKTSKSFVRSKSVCGEERRANSQPRSTSAFIPLGERGENHASVQGKEIDETKASANTFSKAVVENTELSATKQYAKRQFSWTQHVRNCKIFTTDKIKVRVYEADILDAPVDCIVNPANKNLDHHGGLAYTIAKAAGDTLDRESADIVKSKGGSLPVTSVACTTAGNLNYKCILHAVGPCWYDYSPITEGRINECLNHLRLTVINCFIQAERHGKETIALPTISSGLFGVPKELCAIQYAKAIKDFSAGGHILKEIHIVDINHDMIDLVHSVFDAMIVRGKAVNVDVKDYIGGVDTASKVTNGTSDSKRSFKNTARGRPGPLKAYNAPAEIVTKAIRNEETLLDDGPKLICRFSSNHVVQIYEGNILQLQGIYALVCSDNRKGEAKGEVSEQLLQTNGEEYKAEKAGHFKMKRSYGDLVTTSGGKSNFKHIIHAITPKKDIKALHMMYIKLFEEVVKKNVSCFALPLLGTGTGEFGVDESVKVLLEEWATFSNEQKGHALTIHLVLREKTTSDLVKGIFRKHIGGTKRLSAEDFKQITEHSKQNMGSEDDEEDCVICMDKVNIPKKLKCGHIFCTECIEGYFRVKAACPTCGRVCGIITGDQPDGRVDIAKIMTSCTGYEGHRSIAISYYFPPGTQGEEHPRPGSHYRSISRTGYLPDTKEGREICAMLKVAFGRRLVFTIGTSRTTGEEGVITWNDIHHKTDMRPNTQFGYPDKTYLQRVREELAVKGVTEEDIEDKFINELKADTYRCTFTTDTTL